MSQVQVRLPVQTHLALKELAAKQERSVNWLINKVLADAAAKLQGAQQ